MKLYPLLLGQTKKLFVFTIRSTQAAVGFYQATGGVIANGDDFVYPIRRRSTKDTNAKNRERRK